MEKIKVIIADDHLLLVDGIKAAFMSSKEIEVIASFNRATDLLNQLGKYPADVLILDIQFPDRTAHEIIKDLLLINPELKIIILSSLSSNYIIKDFLKKGCRGYLFKDNASPEQLIEAVTIVHAGHVFLDPLIKEEIFLELIQQKDDEESESPILSKREKEILNLIIIEKTNQEIADSLFLSVRTVENNRRGLLQKLGAKNTVGLIKAAVKHNLCDLKI